MILITFVENAFKYGSSSSRDCHIKVKAELKERVLSFETENRIMRKADDGRKGIGLDNCRNRLELLFSGRYCLDIMENENDMFRLKLTIEL